MILFQKQRYEWQTWWKWHHLSCLTKSVTMLTALLFSGAAHRALGPFFFLGGGGVDSGSSYYSTIQSYKNLRLIKSAVLSPALLCARFEISPASAWSWISDPQWGKTRKLSQLWKCSELPLNKTHFGCSVSPQITCPNWISPDKSTWLAPLLPIHKLLRNNTSGDKESE